MKTKLFLLLLLVSSIATSMSAQKDISDNQKEKSYTFYFETNESSVPDDALQTIVKQAKEWQQHKIIIQGHTDNEGKPEYNQILAQERAIAIQKTLLENGIPANRLTVKSWGETRPIAATITKQAGGKIDG